MLSNPFVQTILQSFAFNKLLPGVLIGLFAYNIVTKSHGDDAMTFIMSMIVFWAAIGVGHGIAQIATQSAD